jgi:hypothetical protein
MDSRWFKEDRQLPKEERAKAKAETEKVLKNSTLMSRLLKDICEEEIERTYRVEEGFEDPHYERAIVVAASRRKAFRDIIKLLP